jgi:hypothetical protein
MDAPCAALPSRCEPSPPLSPKRGRFQTPHLRVLVVACGLLPLIGYLDSGVAFEPPGVEDILSREASYPSEAPVQAFCLRGSIMNQLLQGFGSKIVVNEDEVCNLICGTHIIGEHIGDDRATLDIFLQCECVDSAGNHLDVPMIEGRWIISLK